MPTVACVLYAKALAFAMACCPHLATACSLTSIFLLKLLQLLLNHENSEIFPSKHFMFMVEIYPAYISLVL